MDHLNPSKQAFWEDYIGCRDGMVYFSHGAYQLKDIARVVYPADPAMQTWFILKYGG